jgi:hypothetical protein
MRTTDRQKERAPRVPMTGSDRVGALCGAGYVLLILVGNQIATGSQAAHPSGRADLADFAATPTVAQEVGFVMELGGFLAFLFFLGWFAQALRARGGAAAWLGGVVSAAGITTLAVKLASAASILTGELDHRELDPTTARILSDLNGASFVITFLPFAAMILAAGCAVLSGGLLGRVAGWTGVLIGAAGIVVPLLTRLDPVSSNPMGFLLGLLWVLVVSTVLGTRGPLAATTGVAAPGASTAAPTTTGTTGAVAARA